jgi:hypothetical protein
MGPQPIQFHDALYPAFLGALGIDASLPVEEKVRLLKADSSAEYSLSTSHGRLVYS